MCDGSAGLPLPFRAARRVSVVVTAMLCVLALTCGAVARHGSLRIVLAFDLSLRLVISRPLLGQCFALSRRLASLTARPHRFAIRATPTARSFNLLALLGDYFLRFGSLVCDFVQSPQSYLGLCFCMLQGFDGLLQR